MIHRICIRHKKRDVSAHNGGPKHGWSVGPAGADWAVLFKPKTGPSEGVETVVLEAAVSYSAALTWKLARLVEP